MSTHPRIAVHGAGAFGTALGAVLARAGRAVTLIGRDAAVIAQINECRESPKLPGIHLPAGLTGTTDTDVLGKADLVVIGVPTQMLRGAFEEIGGALDRQARIVLLCKGIERTSGMLPHQVAAECLPDHATALLSGPGFAGEIASGLPTAMALGAADAALGDELAAALSAENFRLYATTDVTGVAIGGALKNVLAIACGIVDGRHLGESARAALIARGLAELSRFALAHGAEPRTLSGLSGLGDLVLTATSRQSRNLRFGIALGEGGAAASAMAGGMPLAEGAWTAPIAARLAKDEEIDAPLITAVAALVEGKATVDDIISGLLARPLKREAG